MTDPKLTLRCAHYFITEDAYHSMMAAQQRKCSICEKPFGKNKDVIDHCHTTGIVRGLLCSPCNLLLGRVEAVGIERLARYLEEHANVEPDLNEVVRARIISDATRERLHKRFPDEAARSAYYKEMRSRSKVDPEVTRKRDRERKARDYAANRTQRAAYQKEWAARKRAEKDYPTK